MIKTNNPVLDAELNETTEADREYIECDHCFGKIYKTDSTHDGDDYYRLGDVSICCDCIADYIDENRKECR